MKTSSLGNPFHPSNLVGGSFGGGRRRPGNGRACNYSNPSPGNIYLAFFPFTNGKRGKLRPALLLAVESCDFGDFVMAPLTADSPQLDFEVAIRYWRAAGLDRPGTVRCSRICALDRDNVFALLGRILPEDLRRVVASAKEWFASVMASVVASNLAGCDEAIAGVIVPAWCGTRGNGRLGDDGLAA